MEGSAAAKRLKNTGAMKHNFLEESCNCMFVSMYGRRKDLIQWGTSTSFQKLLFGVPKVGKFGFYCWDRKPERHVRKASHCGSKQQWRSCSQSLLLLLARATYIMVLFFTHIPFVVNHTINATPLGRLQHYHSNRREHPFLLKFFNSCPPSDTHACVWEKVRDTQ